MRQCDFNTTFNKEKTVPKLGKTQHLTDIFQLLAISLNFKPPIKQDN